jgi:hypothetical protein
MLDHTRVRAVGKVIAVFWDASTRLRTSARGRVAIPLDPNTAPRSRAPVRSTARSGGAPGRCHTGRQRHRCRRGRERARRTIAWLGRRPRRGKLPCRGQRYASTARACATAPDGDGTARGGAPARDEPQHRLPQHESSVAARTEHVGAMVDDGAMPKAICDRLRLEHEDFSGQRVGDQAPTSRLFGKVVAVRFGFLEHTRARWTRAQAIEIGARVRVRVT